MPMMTVIEAVREAMREEMQRDASVFVLGEDVGRRGGVFLATQGFIDEFGEQRVLDTPLAEAAIAGVAVGAAMHGMRPIAEIQFGDFMFPVFNQIIGEAARIRYGTRGKVSVPLVVRSPYGGHVRGGLFHSQSPEAYFAHTPGLKVVVPATPYDAKGLLKAAIRANDPVIVLEHKRTYRSVRGEVPDGDYVVPIGVADVKREGDAATIVTYGLTLHYSLQAAEKLAEEGVQIEVVDLRTVKPIDRETILASVRKTNRALVVHEDNISLGVGAEVSAIISEYAFDSLDAPVMRVAGPDIPAMPFAPTLEAAYMPTAEKIEAALRRLLEY
ncbi:MAG: alpha-ketoacid dehydrogenase subunit beta [Chloroflexi bacterium]|nr:alpha-ketoacid dehydrogenase subunit beta [Chloroflexota bacterium]